MQDSTACAIKATLLLILHPNGVGYTIHIQERDREIDRETETEREDEVDLFSILQYISYTHYSNCS